MKEIIDISKWEYFSDLKQNQIEVNGYLFILDYFLNNNTDINNPHYKYYEKKYIESYTNLFFIKILLEDYLKNLRSDIIRWEADFIKQQVTVYYE